MLVQGLQTSSHWVALLRRLPCTFFQPALALFQSASAFSELVQRPGVQLDPQGSTRQQRRVWFRHVESSRLTIVDLFEGVVLNHGVRGAPEPRPV